MKAIGASQEVNDEVEAYLNLVELQSVKENPSQRIIKSNLANAAVILDGYISETLNKPSTVVKNWIDALLLQKVEYKSNCHPELDSGSIQLVNQTKKRTINTGMVMNQVQQDNIKVQGDNPLKTLPLLILSLKSCIKKQAK